MAKLGEICNIVSDSTPKSNVSEYQNGTIDWITPVEINDDTYYYSSERKITEKAVKDTKLKSFPAGIIILSSCVPIGKVTIAGKDQLMK